MVLGALLLAATVASQAPSSPRTHFVPEPTLFEVGGKVFAAGYGPVAAASLPAIAGGFGRAFALGATLGLVCWNARDGYLCKGTHGGVQLALPVAGPFLFASDHPRDTLLNPKGSPLPTGWRIALYVSGATQAVGASLVVASLLAGREVSVPDHVDRPAPARTRLLATGGLLLGAAYAGSFLAAMPSLTGIGYRGDRGGRLIAIPLAGPFLFAALQPEDDLMDRGGRSPSAVAQAVLYGAGAAQVAGAVLLVAGLRTAAPNVLVTPSVTPHSMGVSAAWAW